MTFEEADINVTDEDAAYGIMAEDKLSKTGESYVAVGSMEKNIPRRILTIPEVDDNLSQSGMYVLEVGSGLFERIYNKKSYEMSIKCSGEDGQIQEKLEVAGYSISHTKNYFEVADKIFETASLMFEMEDKDNPGEYIDVNLDLGNWREFLEKQKEE